MELIHIEASSFIGRTSSYLVLLLFSDVLIVSGFSWVDEEVEGGIRFFKGRQIFNLLHFLVEAQCHFSLRSHRSYLAIKRRLFLFQDEIFIFLSQVLEAYHRHFESV